MTATESSNPRTLLPFAGNEPEIADDAWIAPGATVIGAVQVHARSSVWYAAVLRADGDGITVGAGSNIQDGCVVHADPGLPVVVGAGVSVGHRAVLHGCTVGDDVLVGMGALLLNGATVGRGSLVAAGTVLLEGTEIAPGSLVAGVPGRVRRGLTETEREAIRNNALGYERRALEHARVTTRPPRRGS
jgi:carbonic anhydrase/acetyltransferase-like protein (isoleucine patch superfamily)